MTNTIGRWIKCVQHRGEDFVGFAKEFFGGCNRLLLVVLGAGFDPRACLLPELLSRICGDRASALVLREERLRDDIDLGRRADQHAADIGQMFTNHRVVAVPMFATDGKVIGGREVVQHLAKSDLGKFSDLLVDFSALSRGVTFTIVRYLLAHCDTAERYGRINLHLIADDKSAVDASIVSEASDRVEPIHGFRGGWGLESNRGAAKLWLPQLGPGQHVPAILDRITSFIEPDTVCPILPFPADNPRMPDELIWRFRSHFEESWKIDNRDILYADEHRPLDLYRTVLKIDAIRRRVFQEVGGSMTILSPVGRKMLAIGALMAALDRDFPVMHVESIGYHADIDTLDSSCDKDWNSICHIWLAGECYPSNVRGEKGDL